MFQVPLIKECKKQGHFVIATDLNPNAEGFNYSDIALNIDTLDKELTLEKALEYKIDGILTTSDSPVKTVAYVCEKLNLCGLTVSSAEITTNKLLLRQHLESRNIESTRYYNINNINTLLNDLIYPLIVKPVDSSASRGVKKVNNKEQLLSAYEEALSYSKKQSIIIEEYIEGREFSVESLTQNGITHIVSITEKTTIGSPYFVESRHVIPADLTDIENNQIKSKVCLVIDILGINNSACHTEVKLTDKGVRIIEIGARLGGDYITSDLVPLSNGINMLENIIRIALGLQVNIEKKSDNYSGIQFITSDNYDFILKNIDKISKDTNIVNFSINNTLNTNSRLCNSLDRLGYYICVAQNRVDLNNMLDRYIIRK